jgi:hypothetical protein
MVVHGFFAEYYILAKHSNRDRMFEKFARLSTEEELQLNKSCLSAVAYLLPSIRDMIISGEKYALALEQSVLKEMTQQVLDEEKAKE